MEYVVQPDGGYRFDAPDHIALFAGDRGLRFFGHTLVRYAEKPVYFQRLLSDPAAFRDAYAAYIAAAVGRYKGRIVAWDVVNEQVTDEGGDLPDSLWSQGLGRLEHMRVAYELAHAANPAAVLFLNDYSLESNPKKRATFMRLAEDLLKAGAPLMGVGTQTHVPADLPPARSPPPSRTSAASASRCGFPRWTSRWCAPRVWSTPGRTSSGARLRSSPKPPKRSPPCRGASASTSRSGG